MPSSFSVGCPSCGRMLRIRDERSIGRRVRCPECRGPVDIQWPSRGASRPTRRRQASSSRVPLILGGAGLAVALVVVLIVVLTGGDSDSLPGGSDPFSPDGGPEAALNLAYVPADGQTVVIYRSADLAGTPLGTATIQNDDPLRAKLARLENELGLSLGQIDLFKLVMGQAKRATRLLRDFEEELQFREMFAILHFQTDFDLTPLTQGRSQAMTYRNQQIHQFQDSEFACWRADPRTLLLGPPQAIRAAIDRGPKPPESRAEDIPRAIAHARLLLAAEAVQEDGFPGQQDSGWEEVTGEDVVIVGMGNRILDDGRVAALMLWGFESPRGAELALTHLQQGRDFAQGAQERMFGDKPKEINQRAADMFSGAGDDCHGRLLAQSQDVIRDHRVEELLQMLLSQQVDVLTKLTALDSSPNEAVSPTQQPPRKQVTRPSTGSGSSGQAGQHRRFSPLRESPPQRSSPQPGEVDSLLADLRSPSSRKNRTACKRLLELEPVPARRGEVVKALTRLIRGDNQFTRASAVEVLGLWGGAESIPTLAAILKDEDRSLHRPALSALAHTGSLNAVPPLMEALKDPRKLVPAAGALINIGSVAEDRVITELPQLEWRLRMVVCEVLGDIGTEKSREVLRERAQSDEWEQVRHAATYALNRLDQRLD